MNFFQNLHSTKIKTTCSWKIMIICKANDFICQWELIISLGLEVCDVHKKLKKFICSLLNYYSINNILFKTLYSNNGLSNYKRLSMYSNYENTFNKIKIKNSKKKSKQPKSGQIKKYIYIYTKKVIGILNLLKNYKLKWALNSTAGGIYNYFGIYNYKLSMI